MKPQGKSLPWLILAGALLLFASAMQSTDDIIQPPPKIGRE